MPIICPCIPPPRVDWRAALFVIDILSNLLMSSLIGCVWMLGKDGNGKLAVMDSTKGAEGHDILCERVYCLALPFLSSMYTIPVTDISPGRPRIVLYAWIMMVAMATTVVTIMVALTMASVLTSNLKIKYLI